jgi:hypothetical protein
MAANFSFKPIGKHNPDCGESKADAGEGGEKRSLAAHLKYPPFVGAEVTRLKFIRQQGD